jgi:hypothetical protein
VESVGDSGASSTALLEVAAPSGFGSLVGAGEALAWLTGPLSPGLRTRTDTFVFVDPDCEVLGDVSGAGSGARVSEVRGSDVSEPRPAVISGSVGGDTASDVPFSRVTGPSVPGLFTRTETFTLPPSL